MRVDVLGRDRWQHAGDYRQDRALEISGQLRKSGAIVRCDGQPRTERSCVDWTREADDQVWVGRINGTELFVCDERCDGWYLHAMLPGYQERHWTCADRADACDTAEHLLEEFRRRVFPDERDESRDVAA